MFALNPSEIFLGAVLLAVLVMTVRACVRKQQCAEPEEVSLDDVDETKPSTSSPDVSKGGE
jgi:hypothetical protein